MLSEPLTLLGSDLLRACVEGAGTPMVVSDARRADAPLVLVNSAFEHLTGYAASELLGRNCSFLQGVERRQPALIAVRRAIADGVPVRALLRNYRRSGELFWNELTLSPVRDARGMLTHFVGVQNDVTARVRAEQTLAELLDRMGDGFVVLDRECRVLQVNRRMEELAQRSAAEMLGSDARGLFPEVANGRFQRQLARVMRFSEPASVRAFWPSLGRWVEARAYPDTGGVSVYLRDITREHVHRRRLEHLSRFDALTGLPNRTACMSMLVEAAEGADAGRRGLAVASIDLDEFVAVNEARGHAAGDAALKEVAARLVAMRPAGASIARMGADEFVALLDSSDPEEALAACDRLLAAIAEPMIVAGQQLRLHASAGLALHIPGRRAPDVLLADANAAMIVSRNDGGGRTRLFDAALAQAQRRRQCLLDALRSACFEREFYLEYQPKFTARPRVLCGFEALARWNSPALGQISPDEFVPLAEECGAIVPLGLFLLEDVCRQLRAWLDAGYQLMPVAVNVSVGQVSDGAFLERLEECTRRWRLPIALLQFEITESLLMKDLVSGSRMVNALSDRGCEVHLDDFGTGHSSLAYLWELPVSALKLDRRFVRGLGSNPKARAIVESVVALARALDKQVIAEGVETPGQAAELDVLGCQVLQGYLLGRPMPPAQAARLLASASAAGA